MNNTTTNTSSIVSKVWAFCNTLRDDGVGYGDYPGAAYLFAVFKNGR